MTTKRKNRDLSMLTSIPMQPAWLQRLPAYQSNNAFISRGAIQMLFSAFHAEKCGVLDNSIEAVAAAAHLPLDLVTANFKELTTGWRKQRGTLVFEPMAEMAKRLDEKHSDALQDLQDRAVLAICSPDLASLELMSAQGEALEREVGKTTAELAKVQLDNTKVRRTLPEGAVMTEVMRQNLISKNFPLEMHNEIWEMFCDWHISQRTTSASWNREFNRWIMNQIRFGKLSPQGDIPTAFKGTDIDRPPVVPASRRVGVVPHPSSRKMVRAVPQNYKQAQGESVQSNALENIQNARLAVSEARIRKQ